MTVLRAYASGDPGTPEDDHSLADLEALVALDQELFGDEAWDARAWRDLLTGPGRRLLVAERDGVPVGYALTGLVGDFVDLLRIGVAARARRHGVATGLVAAATSAALGDGAERMLLEVSTGNPAARAFYARHGWVEIDRRPRYYRDGSSALVLQRDLTPLDAEPAAQGRMEP